jgi:hypothetical protein
MLNSGTTATGLETDIENGGCTLNKAPAPRLENSPNCLLIHGKHGNFAQSLAVHPDFLIFFTAHEQDLQFGIWLHYATLPFQVVKSHRHHLSITCIGYRLHI